MKIVRCLWQWITGAKAEPDELLKIGLTFNGSRVEFVLPWNVKYGHIYLKPDGVGLLLSNHKSGGYRVTSTKRLGTSKKAIVKPFQGTVPKTRKRFPRYFSNFEYTKTENGVIVVHIPFEALGAINGKS